MQIKGDYNSYSSTGYAYQNTRPLARPPQEEKSKQEEVPARPEPFAKRSLGALKSFWASLGEESVREQRGIEALTSAVREIFPYRFFPKWDTVREKIRVGISAALKRFGKESAAFGALKDAGARFAGHSGNGRGMEKEKAKEKEKTGVSFSGAALSDSHLMDSYSKTGAYCRLNENLTYQKNSPSKKGVKPPAKEE